MFVRVNCNASGLEYLQILRSYRQDGKVKQEVLFTLGRLDVLQATGQLDALVSALARHCTRQKLVDLSKDVSVEQVHHLGAAYVVNRMRCFRNLLWVTRHQLHVTKALAPDLELFGIGAA